MIVWVFQTGEPLHLDEGNHRPMRAMNLANSLVDAGHKVVLWSSGFFHQEKRHRTHSYSTYNVSDSLQIRLIPSPGYQRNIGFGRLWDHACMAINLQRILKQEHHKPDIAFIGFPPIETAYVMVRWLKASKVTTILDIKDQWPVVFLEALPAKLDVLGRFILWPYFTLSKRAMKQSTGLTAMATEFLNWGLGFSGKEASRADGVFPLTSPEVPFTDDELDSARDWWKSQGVIADPAMFRIMFVGSHTVSFDFKPVKDAARRALEKKQPIQFVVAGNGDQATQLKNQMGGLANVIFPGWIDRAKVKALAELSHAAVVPYRNTDNFMRSIPNKVVDALSLRLPILSSLEGEVAKLVSSSRIGLSYDSARQQDLYDCISYLIENPNVRDTMANNARAIYDETFSYDRVYSALVHHLENLVTNTRASEN